MRVCILESDFVSACSVKQMVASCLLAEGIPYTIEHCTNANEMLALRGRPLDLVIANVCLNGDAPDGIEAIRLLQQRAPYCQIIYLSNQLRFATRVYDTPHIFFILWDELPQWLPIAMERVLDNLDSMDDRLLLTRKDSQILLEQDDILYCEQSGRKTSVLALSGEFSVYESVSEILDRLDSARFIQCHRSFLVGLRYVSRLTYDAITLPGGLQIPISRTRYATVKSTFTQYVTCNLMLPQC